MSLEVCVCATFGPSVIFGNILLGVVVNFYLVEPHWREEVTGDRS